MDMRLPADIAALTSRSGSAGQAGCALAIRGVHKRFEHFVALQKIELEVREGEMLCLLGPSGCGKTTLLRIIAGLETQTRGQILQNGPGRFLAAARQARLWDRLPVVRAVPQSVGRRQRRPTGWSPAGGPRRKSPLASMSF